MTVFDFVCPNGHEQIDVYVSRASDRPPCPDCGAAVTIIWKTSFPNVISDACDFKTDNMSGTLEHFTSRAEHRRRAKELGLRIRDEHNPPPGSDKSKWGSKWT